MGLSQALYNGISGLSTHQKCMDNIGNNLANVNTTGFKKGVFQFRTILEQTFRGGMGADGQTGRGSINPISMGLGTQVGSINKVFTQGNIENTGNPKDMALEGNGFFVLKQGNGYALTRDGSFYIGADGSLMGGNGLYVQGTMAVKDSNGSITIPQDARLENIIIPIGQTGGVSQTSMVEFKGNLDSRQDITTGLRLFGSVEYPDVNSLQKWMWKDFNGGNPFEKQNVDETWDALQKQVFTLPSQDPRLGKGSSITIPNGSDAVKYPSFPISVTEAYDVTTGEFVQLTNWPNNDPRGATYPPAPSGATIGWPVPVGNVSVTMAYDVATKQYIHFANPVTIDMATITADPFWTDGLGNAKLIPVQINPTAYDPTGWTAPPIAGPWQNLIPAISTIQTINGGNVQTSSAMAVKVPEPLPIGSIGRDSNGVPYTVQNDATFPEWLYEAYGGNFQAAAATPQANVNKGKIGWEGTIFDENTVPPGDPLYNYALLVPPRKDETFPASLNTPLEHIMYQTGNTWTTPFANIKNGQNVTMSFKKGHSQVDATFTYNRPEPPPPFGAQQPLNIEQSYTLGHLLKFMGGDVDDATKAALNIKPYMFGAPITDQYPNGDPTDPAFDRTAYETALNNVNVAKQEINMRAVGGVMGLIQVPPQIGPENYGPDGYNAPPETAGAFSRTGISNNVGYERWNPTLGVMQTVYANSFNVSFVSNLGSENAISDLRFSYNNVPYTNMFSAETKYAAPQGGSAVASMTFYDSLGNPKQAMVRMSMVDQNSEFTTWRWYADCVDDTDFPWQVNPETGEIISNLNTGTGLIRFDKNGNFVKGSEYSELNGITINLVNQGVNNPILINLLNGLDPDSKQDLDFSFLTMSAAKNDLTLKSQNGAPPGTLDSFQVSLDGLIQGVYSNGVVAPIGRLVLALIPNENGLVAAGNNLFYTGPASGDAQYGYANVGGRAQVRQYQLETSNVELSDEFTKLITTERGFQANARTVTTADNMLQELINLKR